MQVHVGDEVQVAPGLTGLVEEVVTAGAVMDPLTIEEIVGTVEDPAVVIVTGDGVKTAVSSSEILERKAAAPVAAPPPGVGDLVAWDGRTGVVDLVVASGQVPGVPDVVIGTKSDPALRVRTLQVGDDGATTAAKAAVRVSELTPVVEPVAVPSPGTLSATPPAAYGTGGAAVLVDLVTAHEAVVTDPAQVPPLRAVKAAWERGLASWPGEAATAVSQPDWAAGRVKAFLRLAAGEETPGYTRDRDLLAR